MAIKQSQQGQPANYNASAPTLTDGDPSALNVDVNGNLKVNVAAGTSGGTSDADEATLVPGTSLGTPVGGIYETTPTTLTNNQFGIFGVDNKRNVKVVGSIASGATDSGAPVKVGGVYNTALPTLTNGQRGDAQLTAAGELIGVGSYKETSFTTTTAQAVASTDVTNYRWVSVHVVTQGGSSTVNFQGSNDNTNWVSVLLTDIGQNSQPTFLRSTTNASIIFTGPLSFRYFRLNVTGIVSGTTAGVVEFFTQSATPLGMGITNFSGNNVGVSAAQSGTWTTVPTAGTTGGATYSHVAAGQATTVIKGTPGVLYAVVFNGAATATNVTTIYDNASGSGTVIAIPAATTTTVLPPLTFGPTGIAFTLGCTVITTTANGADMTFCFK